MCRVIPMGKEEGGRSMTDKLFGTMFLMFSILCISWIFVSIEATWINMTVLAFGGIFAYIYTSMITENGRSLNKKAVEA